MTGFAASHVPRVCSLKTASLRLLGRQLLYANADRGAVEAFGTRWSEVVPSTGTLLGGTSLRARTPQSPAIFQRCMAA